MIPENEISFQETESSNTILELGVQEISSEVNETNALYGGDQYTLQYDLETSFLTNEQSDSKNNFPTYTLQELIREATEDMHYVKLDNIDEGQEEMPFTKLDTIEEAVEESPYTKLDPIKEDKEESLRNTEDIQLIYEETKLETSLGKTKVQWINEDEEEEDLESERCCRELPEVHPLHPDIDQGWAWMVLLAIFFLFFFHSGLLASNGLYYQQMLLEFGQSRSSTAWMGSLMNAFFMLAGPLSSAFIERLGCRASIIFGSSLMTIGYLASAFAPSLMVILFTYGIVVATGMNFVYSGQIIALAQYFSKRHSVATSVSMVGIGIGMFILVQLLEYVICELGWRNSFVICAGLSIQCIVFGFLIFPLKNIEQLNNVEIHSFREEGIRNTYSQEEFASIFRTPAGKRIISEGNALNRSVSSLRLSVGAGYLSSSLASLNQEPKGCSIYSNQHSFCSKASYHNSGLGSNPPSCIFLRNSHLELTNSPLRSNQNSFCSRGSFYGIRSLRSNPHSFSIRNSQMDLQQHYYPILPILRDSDLDALSKRSMFLSRSPSKMSNLPPLKENEISSMTSFRGNQSRCSHKLILNKMRALINDFKSGFHLELLLDSSFWLLNLAMFSSMFATVKLFIIYKELSSFLGVEDYYSWAISVIGFGDMVGRLSGGILASLKWVDPILCYGIAMLLCGVAIGFHKLVESGSVFLVVTCLFGLFYGQQNVLITIAPSVLFGKDKLVVIFGYVLFFAGLGALIGAPVAGYIVDVTGSYNGVLMTSSGTCIFGGICMCLCYLLSKERRKQNPLFA